MHRLVVRDLETQDRREVSLPAETSLAAARQMAREIKAASRHFQREVLVMVEFWEGGRERIFYE